MDAEQTLWTLYLLGVFSHFRLWIMVFDADPETKDKNLKIYFALAESVFWPVMAVLGIVLAIFVKKKENLSDEDMFEP